MRKIASGQRFRVLKDLVVGAGRDYFTAGLARAGAEVEDAIGCLHDVGIVFNDEDRVPEIAQVMKNFDKAMSVARVEADRGLIEHVERSH